MPALKTAYLNLRLFLEGIEVPVISAQISGAPNQPVQASIQLVPTPMAHRIMARTKVDLFFHDLYAYQEAGRSRVAAGVSSGSITWVQQSAPVSPASRETQEEAAARQAAGGETLETLEIPPDLIRYRLLFTGEVIGFSYVKRAGDRGVLLQCLGCSSYWDLLAASRGGDMLFGGGVMGGGPRTRAGGFTHNPFWDLLGGSTGQVYDKLTTPPQMFPNLRGFAAGLMHCMEGIFGVYTRKKGGQITKIMGANQFLALASIRLKLLQQIGIAGGGDSPLKLLRRRGFGSIWRPALRGLPRYFGFRHLVNALMPYTFMEHVPIIAPHYSPPTGYYANIANWAGFDTGILRNSPQWSWIPRTADRIARSASHILDAELADIEQTVAEEGATDPNEYSTFLDDCRSRLESIRGLAEAIRDGVTDRQTRSSDDALSVPDPETGVPRVYYPTDPEYDEYNSLGAEAASERGITRVAIMVPAAHRRLEKVASRAREISTKAKEAIQRLRSTTLPAAPDPRFRELLESIREGARYIGDFVMDPPTQSSEDADSEPARLYCDVFRPDCWFAPAPRSNVIFPDHTVGLTYGRIFGQEPTRLLIRMYDKLLGSNPFFDKWWFAPLAPGMFSYQDLARSGQMRMRIKRDLMDHELAGGIVPVFHSMSDREMFLGARIPGFAGREGWDQIDPQSKRYFQQVANFLLFRARFGARTLQLDLRFDPYLILGFPAVVIDIPPDETQTQVNQLLLNAARDALEGLGETEAGFILEILKNRCGTHFLGQIVQIQHVVNATGENCGTSVVLGQAREHNEKIEYMGQDLVRMAQERALRNRDHTVRRTTAEWRRRLRDLMIERDLTRGVAYQVQGSEATYTSDVVGGWEQATIPGTDIVIHPATDGAPPTNQDAFLALNNEINRLQDNPDYTTVQVQVPPTRTSLVFALDPPIARRGTPARDGQPASEDYQEGQYGPNGGEIIEVVDVTDQYRDRRVPRNVSGMDASYIQFLRESQQRLSEDIEEGWQNYRELHDVYSRDPEVRSDGTTAQTLTDRHRQITEQEEIYRRRQEEIDAYDAGWVYEYQTLPFLGTGRDGRNKPITTITTNKIGRPVSVEEIPELVGIIGTTTPSACQVILRVYRITEDMQNLSGMISDMAAEDILRPPWYSADWLNRLVGGAVYLPLFGIGSIVDPIAIMRPESIDIFGQADLASESIIRIRQSIQYNEQGTPVMSGILEGASIENAIDFLVHTYSITKQGGYDVDALIHNYTWRPIATIFDMFGSGDLVLDEKGESVVHGVEGFHSRAFGPYSNLFGLIPSTDVQSFLGVDRDDAAAAARVDIRGRRYAIIQAYRLELLRMRGCAAG